MKESAQIALSYVRSQRDALGIAPGADQRRFHVHFPAGAVPKDGPSAGVTMTSALVSLLTGRPVRREVGMTGEVTLQGRVLPIGGVKQKVLAAHRAGLTEVILPARNGVDLDDVPETVREQMTFHLVDDVADVVRIALAAETPWSRRRSPAPRLSPPGLRAGTMAGVRLLGAEDTVTLGRLVWAVLVTSFFCLPLAISLWAFLDAARRPQWAWALSPARQVVWMVAIPLGVLTVVGGLLISLWYLLRIRPLVAATERGELQPRRSAGGGAEAAERVVAQRLQPRPRQEDPLLAVRTDDAVGQVPRARCRSGWTPCSDRSARARAAGCCGA